MKKFLSIIFIPALVFISCQKELSVSPEDQLSKNLKLIVDSEPQGARIFIDNLNTGQTTPDTIEWVEPGNHLLKLKLNLYKDTSVVINISETEVNQIFLDYNSNPSMLGRLSVESKPSGAEIYLNGENTTFKTPKTLTGLVPGKHEVTLKLKGYWDLSTEETVFTGNTSYINRVLVDTLVWVNFSPSNIELPTYYFSAIDIQHGYIKWLAGSQGDGLIRYDDTEWTVFKMSNSQIPSDNITDIHVHNDDVWIGTDNGAARYNNGTWQIYNMSNSPLQTNRIECIFVDHINRVWIGTFNKGTYVLDGGSWTTYNKTNSPMPTDNIKSILVEPNGSFWIGTNGGGLVQFDGIDWRITTRWIPRSKIIDFIHKDDFSNIWIGCSMVGTDTGGVAARTNNIWNKFYTYSYSAGRNVPIAGHDVKDFAVDKQKNLWFASFEFGLVKYNGEWKILNLSNSKLISNRINGIAIDGEGHKWITTYGEGIIKYKGD
jgi:streptogramin lyase